jgi:hypothetical protein
MGSRYSASVSNGIVVRRSVRSIQTAYLAFWRSKTLTLPTQTRKSPFGNSLDSRLPQKDMRFMRRPEIAFQS